MTTNKLHPGDDIETERKIRAVCAAGPAKSSDFEVCPVGTVAALKTQRDELLAVLQGIANAKRFDRTIFPDDDAFVGWAQSIARHAIAKVKQA